jgi:hypothetical protein
LRIKSAASRRELFPVDCIPLSDAARLEKDGIPACNQSTLTHRNQLGYSSGAILNGNFPNMRQSTL